jgi:hypothetical protein
MEYVGTGVLAPLLYHPALYNPAASAPPGERDRLRESVVDR